MDTTVETASPAPEPGVRGTATIRPKHPNPELASWTQAHWYRVLVLDLLITLIGVIADAVMASAVLTLVLASAGLEWMAVPTAFSLVGVACAVVFTAGKAIHHSPTLAGRAWGWALLGAWAALGLGLVVLRALHSQIATPDTGNATDPADIQQILDRAHAADLGIAAVMALVYAGTGLLLVHAAKDLANPDLLRMLHGRRALDAHVPAWIGVRNRVTKHALLLERRAGHIRRWLPHELELELASSAAGADLAKELSRLAQAELIAQPRATLMTLLEHFPGRKATPHAPTAEPGSEGTA